MRHKSLWLFAALLFLAPLLRADNYIRSVRVSWVEGDVQVLKPGDAEAQPAIPNMPVIEGMAFTTANDGVLELELEDGSTVRLAPDSALRIPELVTSDGGARRSTFEAQRGTVYVDFKHHGDDELYFRFPGHDIRLSRSVRLRAEVAATEAQIAVFSGEFEVRGPDDSVKVKKEETISLGLGDDPTFVLAKSIDPAPYDDWNHKLDQVQEQYASTSSNGNFWSNLFGSGYSGGNLNSYGQTFYLPAYGQVWQPYNLSGPPCSTGYWSWYPGWGWTFISASPWGWGPCNYGTWNYAPVQGWVWCPPRHHHHHLWANWSPTPRWGTVPAGFVPPRRPVGNVDGHARQVWIAQGNVPPNPRQWDRDNDRDPRHFARPVMTVNHNTLIGKGTRTGSFETGSAGTHSGASLAVSGGRPSSVGDLRRELGGQSRESIPSHIVKEGMLRRVPPQSNAISNPSFGATAGAIQTQRDDSRRGKDDSRFHNQVGTTTVVTTPRNDSHPAPPPKTERSNSGWGWHPNHSANSNNSSGNNSGGTRSSVGGSHPSGGGGSSYHPSGGGGGGSHPSGGGGGSSHSGGGGGGSSGGGHSGGSSSSSSSGSHSGKH
jgi:hypothetical protein